MLQSFLARKLDFHLFVHQSLLVFFDNLLNIFISSDTGASNNGKYSFIYTGCYFYATINFYSHLKYLESQKGMCCVYANTVY